MSTRKKPVLIALKYCLIGVNKMIFGNATWGFRNTPLEEALKITSEMGLSAFELGIANAENDISLDITDAEIEKVKRLYEKYGLDISCAATGNDFTNGDKNDVAKIKKVIDICVKMGVKYLRIFSGFSQDTDVTGTRWKNMIDCLKEVFDYAYSKNVVLAIETHGGVEGFDDGVRHYHSTSSNPEMLCSSEIQWVTMPCTEFLK